MQTDRRRFIEQSFLTLSGVVAAKQALSLGLRPGQDLDAWVEAVRDQIPATTRSRYFQTAGIGPSPDAVIEETASKLAYQNRSPADPTVASTMAAIEPRLRRRLAESLGADDDEVALTHSTSEGINIVSWSLAWKPGDEVVISNQEHPANIIPWYNLRDRFGIAFRQIDLDAGTDLLREVDRALSARTRLLSLSHVSRNNGRRIADPESAALAQRLRARGIRYHLDGAQGPGCVPVDFHALGCDYYATCGHKWLLGPKGTGALLVRRAILDDTLLSWTGSHSHDTMDYEGSYTLKPEASRFEFGTRALATFAGFEAALEFWDRIGWDRALTRMEHLAAHAIARIDDSSKLTLSSPRSREHRTPIVSVRLPDGTDSTALYHRLRDDRGILASPVRDERDFRLAIHFFNTTGDIDEALTAIERRV